MDTYKQDSQLQEIIDGKLAGADNWPEYSFTADILMYKRRIVIGKEDDLREKRQLKQFIILV